MQQLLAVIAQEVRPMLLEAKEEMPEAYEMIVNSARKHIEVEADLFDLHWNAQLQINNLDRLILEDSVVMKNI